MTIPQGDISEDSSEAEAISALISHFRSIGIVLLVLLLPGMAHATSVEFKALNELMQDADHVLVAIIGSVDMVDGRGRPVTAREARTGPRLNNEMSFNLDVEEVLFTSAREVPERLKVPLWKAWHYELGKMQDQLTGSRGIFLLRGDAFLPVYPAYFQRELEEREEIEVLLAALKSRSQRPVHAAAEVLSKQLSETDHVDLFFVSRAGDYNYDRENMRRESSVRLYRGCGANCASLLGPLVEHLASARPAECQDGQQSLLLEMGGEDFVMYSYSGRMIRYRSACYFNPENVRDVLRQTELAPY